MIETIKDTMVIDLQHTDNLKAGIVLKITLDFSSFNFLIDWDSPTVSCTKIPTCLNNNILVHTLDQQALEDNDTFNTGIYFYLSTNSSVAFVYLHSFSPISFFKEQYPFPRSIY